MRPMSTGSSKTSCEEAAGGAKTAKATSTSSKQEDDDDPTAAAHGYLAEFLHMSEEGAPATIGQVQVATPDRRGPDEITVAEAELAPAASKAAEAASSAVLATAADPSSPGGGGDTVNISDSGGGGEGSEGPTRRRETAVAKTEAAVRATADKATMAAAGRVLVPQTPALPSMLYVKLGLPKEKVKLLLLEWPRLLEVSGYNIGVCIEWLTESVGMTKKEAGKVVLAHPAVFIKSINFQLKPNLRWLENDLGLSRSEAREVVCSCPRLLTMSLLSSVPKMEFLERKLGFDRDRIGSVLVWYPQLFNYSLQNMMWKARWLEEELLLEPFEVKDVLMRFPSLFAYSAERNLVPTLEFFLDELGATKRQVREAVKEQPRLLGMSLEKRLVPRLQTLRKAGVTPSWELHHTVMLFASDVEFGEWLAEEVIGAAQRRSALRGGVSHAE